MGQGKGDRWLKMKAITRRKREGEQDKKMKIKKLLNKRTNGREKET